MVVAAGMAAQSIDFAVHKRRTVSLTSLVNRGRGGFLQDHRITSVNGFDADFTAENPELKRIELIGAGTDSVPVVFDDKDDGQFLFNRETNGLVEFALSCCCITDVGDHDSRLLTEFQRPCGATSG